MADWMRTPRRRKTWVTIPQAAANLDGAATSIGGTLAFVQAGNTVMRTISEYWIGARAVTVVFDNALITVVLGIFSTDAIAAGAGSIVDPDAEPEYPWLYWKAHEF